jgi:hypothetical protein
MQRVHRLLSLTWSRPYQSPDVCAQGDHEDEYNVLVRDANDNIRLLSYSLLAVFFIINLLTTTAVAVYISQMVPDAVPSRIQMNCVGCSSQQTCCNENPDLVKDFNKIMNEKIADVKSGKSRLGYSARMDIVPPVLTGFCNNSRNSGTSHSMKIRKWTTPKGQYEYKSSGIRFEDDGDIVVEQEGIYVVYSGLMFTCHADKRDNYVISQRLRAGNQQFEDKITIKYPTEMNNCHRSVIHALLNLGEGDKIQIEASPFCDINPEYKKTNVIIYRIASK